MLETLHDISWSELNHAYGSAEDIPEIILNLLSADEATRQNAQEMLYIGVLHQGISSSCTPYVVRFLIELLGYENTPEKGWIIRFLANAAVSCYQCMEVDFDIMPQSMRDKVPSEEQHIIETQVCEELTQGLPLFESLLSDDNIDIRTTVPVLLVRLNCQDKTLEQTLIDRIKLEQNDKVKAAQILCLSVLGNRPQTLQSVFESQTETPIARLAAGFGLINIRRNRNPDDFLNEFAELIETHPDEVQRLDQWHSQELIGITRVWLHDRILGWLLFLDSSQRVRFIPAVTQLYEYARGITKFGEGHYQGVLKQLQSKSQ